MTDEPNRHAMQGEDVPPWEVDAGTTTPKLDRPIMLHEGRTLAWTEWATLVTYPGEGHMVPVSHWGEMLAALS